MKQSLFAKMLNAFWTTLLLTLLLFALFRHYFPAKSALVFALLTSTLCQIIITKLKNKKLSRLGIKTKELEHAEKTLKALYVAQDSAVDLFFLKSIKKSFPHATLKNGWIITPKQAFCCCFSNKTTSAKEISNKIANCPQNNLEKVCFGLAFETEADCLKIKLLDGVSTYAFLKTQKIFPKVENIKTRRKNILKHAISKKNFSKYFFLAIIFSLSAFFVQQKILYFIFSAIVTFLAILSLFSKSEKIESFSLK